MRGTSLVDSLGAVEPVTWVIAGGALLLLVLLAVWRYRSVRSPGREGSHRETAEEHRRLAEIFEKAPSWIAVLDGPDHVFVRANPAYYELVGDRELMGRPVREVFPELEGKGYFETLDRVYETGEAVEVQERPLLLDGADGETTEEKYLTFVYQPRRDGGEITGVIAHGVDVTEQVERRQEAVRRKERLDRILETSADGVLLADTDGNFTFANPAAEEMLGLGTSEIADRSYRDPAWGICGPDGGPFPDEQLPVARVLRTGEAVKGVEHGVERPDGTLLVLSVNAAPLFGPDGEVRGVVASLRNVTERRKLERSLRRREQRYATVLTEISDVVTILDQEGTIRYESPSIEQVFGYDPEELVGRPVFELIHPDDVDRTVEAFTAVLEGRAEAERTVQYRHRHVDGSWRQVESTGVLPEDEALGPVVVTRDITERVEAQQKYRAMFTTNPSAVSLSTLEGGVFVDVNPAFEELLGYARAEVVGSTVEELGLWSRPEARDRVVADVRETGAVHNREVELRTAGGERLHALFSASILEIGDRRYLVGASQDITERKRFEEELEHRSLHDPLTGLANRTLLAERVEQGLAMARRRGSPLGLFMLDVDHFKRVNDRLGHAAGDRVLTELAHRLQAVLRESDTVARWGGDEFFVVLPELEQPDGIARIRERIREAVRSPIEVEGEAVTVDVTIGAVLHGDSGWRGAVQTEDPDELIRFGSLALHRAKENAPAGFRLFDADAGGVEEGAVQIRRERALRDALEDDRIVPHYQPIVRLEDGTLVGVEALARWRHPERGMVPPAEFIPLAEELGLIGALDETVLREGSREVAGWIDAEAGGPPVRVAFNLSGQQFAAPRLVERLHRRIEEAGLRPGQVNLEVTETSLMRVPATIEELRARGFSVFVDDFGTGYSTFAYLRDLELDGLKIDMSFVQGIVENPSDAALVETMLTLGRKLGLTVIAEGIETVEQHRKLRDLGCELGQGYLFARPMPAAEMASRWRAAGG